MVELVTEIYGVDIVALEVGEHDDLRAEGDKFGMRRDWKREDKGRTKKTMVKRRPAAIRTEKRKSHPAPPIVIVQRNVQEQEMLLVQRTQRT